MISDKEVLIAAINTYGEKEQELLAQEECAELIEAISHRHRGRPHLFYRMIKIEDGFTCRDDNGRLLRSSKAVEYFRDKNKKFIRDNWLIISPEGEVIFNDGG